MVYCYFNPMEGAPEPGEIHLIHFTPTFVSTFPVQVFAFTCAQNVRPGHCSVGASIHATDEDFPDLQRAGQQHPAPHEHRHKHIDWLCSWYLRDHWSIRLPHFWFQGLSKRSLVVTISLTSRQVGANVIAMYPSTSIFIAIGQLAIAILVMFSYPLQVHPCRNCLDKAFHLGGYQASSSSLVDDNDGASVTDEHGAGEMSTFKHTVLSIAIIASGFSIAYFVDNLQMGELTCAPVDSMRTHPHNSSLLRRLHRVDHGFLYTPGPVFLEAHKERPGDRQDVESVRARPRNIWNASIRILVRKFYFGFERFVVDLSAP